MFGFDIQDYVCSPLLESVHFLGCRNVTYGGVNVPAYDEQRMLFATVFVGGALTDEQRCQRLSGLAHNVAFSDDALQLILDFARWLELQGRWRGCPLLDVGVIRSHYMPGLVGGWRFKNTIQCLTQPESLF